MDAADGQAKMTSEWEQMRQLGSGVVLRKEYGNVDAQQLVLLACSM
jgi:hypothetical protein